MARDVVLATLQDAVMQTMKITHQYFYELLKEYGVDTLYHANSVITSCQFLRSARFLSRGAVVEKGLRQTEQITDELDRKYGIWNDIFFDSVDIHNRADRMNLYGPVLFEVSTEILNESNQNEVWVTKLNPTKWDGKEDGERWFVSDADLRNEFAVGNFDQSTVFRNCDGELPLQKYLRRITLDDPVLRRENDKEEYYNIAYEALCQSMDEGGIQSDILKRDCPRSCECLENYKGNRNRVDTMFLPEDEITD